MKGASIYIRQNGAFGSACDGCLDTGHVILEDSGRFTVYSIHDGADDTVIALNTTRQQAEQAITKDWRSAQ